jgi:hypothetical protein
MLFVITRRLSRPVAAVALLTGLLGGVTACNRAPAEPTDVVSAVDLARATVLSTDPVLKKAISPPDVMPGRVRSAQLGWDRTQVIAQLYLVRTGPDGVDPTPTEVERQLTAVITTMRDGGWNVHWAVCVPHPSATVSPSASPAPSSGSSSSSATEPTPSPSELAPSPSEPAPSPSPSQPATSPSVPGASPSASPAPSTTPSPSERDLALSNVPVEVPQYDGWEEVVMVNKLSDGVSYWGMLVATIIDDSGAFINLTMRAPNVRDVANLFPVPPPQLPAGSTCAEDGKTSTTLQAAGVPVLIKDWLPFPAQSKSPDPHRL